MRFILQSRVTGNLVLLDRSTGRSVIVVQGGVGVSCLSADGRFVAFRASDIFQDDGIYRHDRQLSHRARGCEQREPTCREGKSLSCYQPGRALCGVRFRRRKPCPR